MFHDVPPEVLTAAASTLHRLGPDKFSIGAVAAAAEMPAETVLELLGSREAAMNVAAEYLGDWYFRALDAIAGHEDTLAGAVAEGCLEFTAHRRRNDQIRSVAADSILMVRLLAEHGHDVLPRAVRFWEPHIRAAQQRGEVAAEIEPWEAAEWILRLMLSFELLPPITVNLEDADEVRRFVTSLLVRGLGPRAGS